MPVRPLSRLLPALSWLAVAAVLACAADPATREPAVSSEAARNDGPTLLEATAPAAAARRPDAGATAAGSVSDSQSRPGRLLVYSAITGHVPLKDQVPSPSDVQRSPAAREAARARALEAEIEEELSRQEQLGAEELPTAARKTAAPSGPPGEAEPLSAPETPTTRTLPDSLFRSDEVTIPPGRWQNRGELRLIRMTLDVDKDGKPEEVRYLDPRTRKPVRVEQDLDYDGELDAWLSYEGGEVAVRVLDSDGNGDPDAWERYAGGHMTARTLDSDGDGVKDTFYRYEGNELVERLGDTNNDGTIDRVVVYENRHKVRSEEDRSLNGWMETWTFYQVVDGQEVVSRVERDSRDHGKADIFETYATRDGNSQLTRREEDINGDGTIDVVSVYEQGKLVQRAISDEALSPL